MLSVFFFNVYIVWHLETTCMALGNLIQGVRLLAFDYRFWVNRLVCPMLQLLYKVYFATPSYQVWPDESEENKWNATSVCRVELWPHTLRALKVQFWPMFGSVGRRCVVLTHWLLVEPFFNSQFTVVENVTVGKLKEEERSVHSQKVHFRDDNVRQDFVGFC